MDILKTDANLNIASIAEKIMTRWTNLFQDQSITKNEQEIPPTQQSISEVANSNKETSQPAYDHTFDVSKSSHLPSIRDENSKVSDQFQQKEIAGHFIIEAQENSNANMETSMKSEPVTFS